MIKLNVDNNTGLVTLKVNGNNLTQFKVANNTALETLWVSDNKLSVINVRSNTALKDLRMSNNIDIIALYLKSNTALETLYADGLSISEINLVENGGLSMIALNDNKLLSLAYMWDDFNSYNGYLYVNHNFTFANASGVEQIKAYERVGTYVTSIASTVGGVIFTPGYVLSTEETSASWYNAKSWCSSYGDGKWYLPIRSELQEIYNNKSTLNNTLTMCGGTTLGISWYWSSTEGNGGSAYLVEFSDGSSGSYDGKSEALRVRAVRAL